MAFLVSLESLPEAIRDHVDPATPAALRLMAAKGVLPLAAKDMVTVLVCLTYDEDEKVTGSAGESLAKLPARVLHGALKDELPGEVLDHLARHLPPDDSNLEAILINPKTLDETYEYLAIQVKDRLLDIVANNQVRILRHPPIANALLGNPTILKSTVEMLMDFAVRTGMEFAGMAAFEEAKKRVLSAAPASAEEKAKLDQIIEASLPDDMVNPAKEIRDTSKTPEEAKNQEIVKTKLLVRLHTMTPVQKLALANKANKTILAMLIKDPNKAVALTAIRNPLITISEIQAVVTNRALSEEVLRVICMNREWNRDYHIKLALVNNPKAPLAFTMRLLLALRASDLRSLSTNKNVPSALAIAARKIVASRSAGK